MKDPIKLVKMGWKAGMTILVVTTMFVGGLVLNLNAVSANSPHLTLLYLGINNTNGGSWEHSVNVSPGQEVAFYAEIHNDVIGTTANNVKIKVSLPSSSGTSTATVSSDNTNTVSDNVNITVNGGQLEYIPGSASMTWDQNGDGTKEYNGSQISDNIVGNGVVLGNQNGCYNYIIQVGFKAKVVARQEQPSPTPSPSPAPPASPTPTPGPTIINTNTNTNTQNQTVNIAGATIPAKQPETGVSVLGLTSMAGAVPVGYMLSRFGRGRTTTAKREETLEEVAMDIFKKRSGKSKNA